MMRFHVFNRSGFMVFCGEGEIFTRFFMGLLKTHASPPEYTYLGWTEQSGYKIITELEMLLIVLAAEEGSDNALSN